MLESSNLMFTVPSDENNHRRPINNYQTITRSKDGLRKIRGGSPSLRDKKPFLKNLEECDLTDDPPIQLKQKMPQMQLMNKLNNRGLDRVPSRIFQNLTLTTLDVSKNRIREVGPLISKLKNLKILDLRHNLLERVPKYIRKLKLKEFYLSNNCIFELDLSPINPEYISILHIDSNPFVSITEHILKFKNLNQFKLDW